LNQEVLATHRVLVLLFGIRASPVVANADGGDVVERLRDLGQHEHVDCHRPVSELVRVDENADVVVSARRGVVDYVLLLIDSMPVSVSHIGMLQVNDITHVVLLDRCLANNVDVPVVRVCRPAKEHTNFFSARFFFSTTALLRILPTT
jgi:hypothetical protein